MVSVEEPVCEETVNRDGRAERNLGKTIAGNEEKESQKGMESSEVAPSEARNKEGREEKECRTIVAQNEETETPKIGMIFDSFDDVRDFYKRYASKQGFGIITRSTKCDDDGNMKYYTIACSRSGRTKRSGKSILVPKPTIKTDCKARINARVCQDGKLYLSGFYFEHNHELDPGFSKYATWHKKLGPRLKKGVESNDQLLIESSGLSEKEIRNYIARSGRLRLGEGDAETLFNYFARMQKQDCNFFYVMNMNKECSVSNVFWADSRCKALYESFGDVIAFETTYLTNEYDLPLVSFVGVNHHGQFTLLGCGLLFHQDTESYIWLFKSWLECMSGRRPKAVVTDQCNAIQAAISEVFPEAKHRLCVWHIMKQIPIKLRGLPHCPEIKKALKNVVYESVTIQAFEESWENLIREFRLEDNEWLKSLYMNRERWVPAFVKEGFWAGLSTTRRKEKINPFFDGYVQSKTSLKQFVEQYDNILRSKIEKEDHADFASSSLVIPTITDFPIEKQFQEVYTNELFKLFQEELRGLIYCNASFIKTEGSVSTFQVKDHVKNKDGSRRKVAYDVTFNEVERDVWCECHLFEFRGILCRHAVAVLFDRDVKEVPSRYVLTRWRKDIKRKHTGVKSCFEDLRTAEQVTRYSELRTQFHRVAEIGSETEENSVFLRKVLDDAEEMLLKNKLGSSRTIQERLASLTKNRDELNLSRKKLHSSSSGRSRGRPPKKNKVSTPALLENDALPSNLPASGPTFSAIASNGWTQENINQMVHPAHYMAIGNQPEHRITFVQNLPGYAYGTDTSTFNSSFAGSYGE